MRLAERHRINPRKKKEIKPKRNPSVKLRRKNEDSEPSVLYMNRSTFQEPSFNKDESYENMLERINSEYSLKVKSDPDSILSEIFKRGWKVPHIELSMGRTYVIRFFREVGGKKSRTIHKKDESLKKLLLKALEYILVQESNRYNKRMDSIRRH